MLPQRMLCRLALAACVTAVLAGTAAAAETCPGNPDALGVSRIITVTPSDYARLGQMQYRHTLPLRDREVVLTFDDGPLPPYSNRVLAALAHECVRATFFMVGRMAAAYPEMVRLAAELGHTIGNHSQNHPIHFNVISESRAESEIENGVRSIKAALAGQGTLAPFFRVPGLGRTAAVEHFLQSRSMVVWSSDTVADDWTRISSDQVLHRALRRLEERGRGILLLHDIQPRTALMLPTLLRELKKRGFRIVHVVPERPAPPAPPVDSVQVLLASAPAQLGWPRVLPAETESIDALAAKAREIAKIAQLASVDVRAHRARGSGPTARQIRPSKREKRVHTATLLAPSRYRPDAIP